MVSSGKEFQILIYTQDALLHITDEWRKAIDKGKYTGTVILDPAKTLTL